MQNTVDCIRNCNKDVKYNILPIKGTYCKTGSRSLIIIPSCTKIIPNLKETPSTNRSRSTEVVALFLFYWRASLTRLASVATGAHPATHTLSCRFSSYQTHAFFPTHIFYKCYFYLKEIKQTDGTTYRPI